MFLQTMLELSKCLLLQMPVETSVHSKKGSMSAIKLSKRKVRILCSICANLQYSI